MRCLLDAEGGQEKGWRPSMKTCTRCQTTLEYIITIDYFDHYYCQGCNREVYYNYEVVTHEDKLTETYGE